MKLLQVGNMILNMDQILAIQDKGDEVILIFGPNLVKEQNGNSSFSVSLQAEEASLIRQWLKRVGVHDLIMEKPVIYRENFLIQDDSFPTMQTMEHEQRLTKKK